MSRATVGTKSEKVPSTATDASVLEHEDAAARALEAIAESFAQTEGRIARRILGAIAVSERAALNVGDSIQQIVSDARRHVERSAALAQQFGADSEIGRSIAQQNEEMRSFVERLSASLRRTRDDATAAQEQLGGILSAGDRIRAVARETKIVTVNAQIEAARLGTAGKPFVVIAEQLAELAEDIEAANRLVGQLARTMGEVIPRLANTTKDVVEDAERFRERFCAALERLEAAQSELHGSVRGAMVEGERCAEAILQGSARALSQLQFQDPMAQSLREVSRISGETRRKIEAAIGRSLGGSEVQEDGLKLRAGELMARLCGVAEVVLDRRPPKDWKHSDDTEAHAPESGDVLLF